MIDERTTIRLRPLSVVDDGDDVLVGDAETGVFVAVPPVGGVVVRAFGRGATLGEASAEAERYAGQPVDLSAFVEKLRKLGFVEQDDAAIRSPGRTAPIQQRGWFRGVSQSLARPFFGRIAWVFYAASFLFCIGCFAFRPDLWPRPGDVFFLDSIGLSALVLYPIAMLGTALHECWHWLAARAAGVQARFGVDLRLYFVVFETDLSQLWALPRRSRFGPLLAGLAIDSVVLAALLAAELTASAWSMPSTLAGLLAAVVFVKVVTITWQFLVFLRTDIYAVLVTATGCRNLWRVKSLLLRKALGRLSPAHSAELAAAAPRDVQAGRWFRWVWLAGLVATAGWYFGFTLPVLLTVLGWTADGLTTGPLTGRFWLTAAGSVMLLWTPAVTLLIAVRTMALRIRGDRLARR
ncbi:hypothetical protein [Actinomadura alba]|uniref:PqqD family peptide modification chaperone n=1 Tax=Actinomadura alba TaxID=406431 RepID=A0ABR7LW20_9ACTN|nr:hypothetical protein [Actinomadura alba]MBC6468779.1 hypothetical protein [Actinomadura alba]